MFQESGTRVQLGRDSGTKQVKTGTVPPKSGQLARMQLLHMPAGLLLLYLCQVQYWHSSS